MSPISQKVIKRLFDFIFLKYAISISNFPTIIHYMDRQTDRQTNRQTDTQTHRQTHRQTDRQTDRQIER